MSAETVRLSVSGAGAVTVHGAGLERTQESLAADPRAFRRLRDYLGTDFKPQLAALAETPGMGQQAPSRMVRHALSALADLQARRGFVADGRGLSVAILLPEPAPDEGLDAAQLGQIASEIGGGVAEAGLRSDELAYFCAGPCGLSQAINAGREALGLGRPLLVLAADSLACRTRMGARARAGRLFSTRAPYAPIPGEAAVALLLEPSDQQGPGAYLLGSALEKDPVTEASDGISTYMAQSDAARGALGGREATGTLRRVLTDWTNGRFRASELAHCELRLQDQCDDQTEVLHMPVLFGDIGAATLPLAIALSLGVAGDHLLLGAGRNSPYRSAAYLSVG